MSVGAASVQNLNMDAGSVYALANYWIFTNLAASGTSPGVTVAPGVTIPLNPDFVTAFIGELTQLGGGAPNLVGWKGSLNASGQGSAQIQTFGPVPVLVGTKVNHAALIYTTDGCGAGCDTYQFATNWVPMTTAP